MITLLYRGPTIDVGLLLFTHGFRNSNCSRSLLVQRHLIIILKRSGKCSNKIFKRLNSVFLHANKIVEKIISRIIIIFRSSEYCTHTYVSQVHAILFFIGKKKLLYDIVKSHFRHPHSYIVYVYIVFYIR